MISFYQVYDDPRILVSEFLGQTLANGAGRRSFLKRLGLLQLGRTLADGRSTRNRRSGRSSGKDCDRISLRPFRMPFIRFRSEPFNRKAGFGGSFNYKETDSVAISMKPARRRTEQRMVGRHGRILERRPYFLDGLLPLACLLDDPRLKANSEIYRLDARSSLAQTE